MCRRVPGDKVETLPFVASQHGHTVFAVDITGGAVIDMDQMIRTRVPKAHGVVDHIGAKGGITGENPKREHH